MSMGAAFIYVCALFIVPVEARRGCWVLWGLESELCAALWVLRIKYRSSGGFFVLFSLFLNLSHFNQRKDFFFFETSS